jgi:hypothetical protein
MAVAAETLWPDAGELLGEFEDHLVVERGLSKRTGRMYRWRLEWACHLEGSTATALTAASALQSPHLVTPLR